MDYESVKRGVSQIGATAEKALTVWAPKVLSSAQKTVSAGARAAKEKLKKKAEEIGRIGE